MAVLGALASLSEYFIYSIPPEIMEKLLFTLTLDEKFNSYKRLWKFFLFAIIVR